MLRFAGLVIFSVVVVLYKVLGSGVSAVSYLLLSRYRSCGVRVEIWDFCFVVALEGFGSLYSVWVF